MSCKELWKQLEEQMHSSNRLEILLTDFIATRSS